MKHRWRHLLTAGAAVWVLAGGGSIGLPATRPAPVNSPPATAPAESPKAWMDANPMVIFPVMDASIPPTEVRLSDSITRGLTRLFKSPATPGGVVHLDGDRYPAISSLHIDLSNAATAPDRSKVKLRKESPIRPGVAVDAFGVIAQPLHIYAGSIDYALAATDAVFDLRADKDNTHTLLVMEDAGMGTFTVTAKVTDLQAALAGAIDNSLAGTGMSVQSVKVKMDTPSPHSLHTDTTISVAELLMPSADAHVQATIDVDDAMNGTIHNLKVSGQGVLGTAFVSLFSGSLSDYQDKTRPLMAFPAGKIHLNSVQFDVTAGTLKINGAFTGTRATTQPALLQ
jgi:hypothetical protein